jgi:hypothetical protein
VNGFVTITFVLNGIAGHFDSWSFIRTLKAFHPGPESIFCLDETFFYSVEGILQARVLKNH